MLVMSYHYASPSSSSSSGITSMTNSPAYDSLPEPRSIVASSQQPFPPPPPPPPFATAAAALSLSMGPGPFHFHLLPPPPPPPPASLIQSFYTPRRERRARKAPHELLTDAEKKANHIASEQKRRHNIKMGFDSLIDAVPTLNHGNRSEALILQKSIEHIHYLISVKNELKNQVRDLQSVLGDSDYEQDSSDDDQSYS